MLTSLVRLDIKNTAYVVLLCKSINVLVCSQKAILISFLISIMFTSRIYPGGGSVLSAMPLYAVMLPKLLCFTAQIIQKLIQRPSLKPGIMKRELE